MSEHLRQTCEWVRRTVWLLVGILLMVASYASAQSAAVAVSVAK